MANNKFNFQYHKKWKWFAVNEDGAGYLYTHKPIRSIKEGFWSKSTTIGHESEYVDDFPKLAKEWRFSLQKRS